MNPTHSNRRFFRQFDPAMWEDEVCADLAPALRRLLAEPGSEIAAMGLENVKMPDLAVLLRRRPSDAALVDIEALCAANPRLRLEAGWVGCSEHYSTVEWVWSQPAVEAPVRKRSLLRRLFG